MLSRAGYEDCLLRGTAEAGGFQPHTSAAHAVAEPTPSEERQR